MSAIGWGIDHYDKITLSCASFIELFKIKLSSTSLNLFFFKSVIKEKQMTIVFYI